MQSKLLIPIGLFVIIAISGLFYLSSVNKKTNPLDSTIFKNPNSVNNNKNDLEPSDLPLTSPIAQNLEIPWALAFLPDNGILFTERPGRVRLIDSKGNLQKDPIYIVPDVKTEGEGGLMGIAVDPDYNKNHFIYLCYTYDSQKTLNRVVRYIFNGKIFKIDKTIVDTIPGAIFHNGGRIKFGPDNFLYITAGDSLEPSLSQNKNSIAGKILRVDRDGQAAPGNPFSNLVYSLGHRNPQGIAWDDKNNLWETEHGQSATDELNFIKPGQNYGWPLIRGDETQNGLISPAAHSGKDTWAPSGMAYLNGSLYFAGLRGQSLYRAKINGEKATITEHFKNQFGRIREVVLGPDGNLYITTNNRDGRGTPQEGDDKIIKINPNKL